MFETMDRETGNSNGMWNDFDVLKSELSGYRAVGIDTVVWIEYVRDLLDSLIT